MKNYGGMWDPRKRNEKRRNENIKISSIITIINAVKRPGYIVSVPMVYSCDLGAL